MAQTATERAYRTIREKIIRLEYAPGELLVESGLAEELGTGRTPVREALKMLACENLVVIIPQRGIYVADISLTDLQEIAELRLAVEGLAAQLAAQRITPQQLERLRSLTHQLAHTAPGDVEKLMEIDRQFHLTVAEAAGNKHLADVIVSLYDKSLRLWRLALTRVGSVASSIERHEELLDALEYGNADKAAEIMREHVRDFHQRMREAF
ncbi:MAG: GntR family transcriptional regulator [Anaerolineae bacterium]|nr:GntR family transcriptional regulator [Anaerolineae bacterium]